MFEDKIAKANEIIKRAGMPNFPPKQVVNRSKKKKTEETNELLEPFFAEKLERANEFLRKHGAPLIDEEGNIIG